MSEDTSEYLHFCKQEARIDRLMEESILRGRQLDIIVDSIAGKQVVDAFTGEPTGHRNGGMDDRLKKLEFQGNGGGGFSMRAKDKAQISAIITVVLVALELWTHS